MQRTRTRRDKGEAGSSGTHLSQLDDIAPGALEPLLPRGGEELEGLLAGDARDFLGRHAHEAIGRRKDALEQRSLSFLVVLGRGREGQIGKAGELHIGAVQEVVDAGGPAVREVAVDLLHRHLVLHLGDPPVEPQLDGSHWDPLELVDPVEHVVLAKALRQQLLDPRHVLRAHDHVEVLLDRLSAI
eukprot:446229-Hanusia_phi.AAC.4